MLSFRIFALALLAVATVVVDGTHFGLQSDDGDIASSFASGMVYDAQKKRIYVTGSTFGGFFDPGSEGRKESSDCFLAVIQLPSRPGDSDPIWLRRMALGNEGIAEACSSIYAEFKGENIHSLYLAGHSDVAEEGIAVSGMILDVSMLSGMQGGYQIRNHQAQYPLFIVSHPENNDLFVASMVSDSPDAVVPSINEQGNAQDNTAAGGYAIPQSDLSILVHRIKRHLGTTEHQFLSAELQDISVSQLWAKEISSSSLLRLTGMMSLGSDRVLIASVENGTGDGDEYHVFLTALNTSTGKVLNSKRIAESVQVGTDLGLGLCKRNHPDESSLYIVGSTVWPGAINTTSESLHPFLMKINTDALEMEWISHLEAISDGDTGGANGLACSVTMDGSLVYIAGNVQPGSFVSLDGVTPAISEGLESADIFVAQVRASDGTVVFARQVGSDQEDRLASGGSAITCDEHGNAIVLGNTRGSMFRDKKSIGQGLANDVVVFTVDHETGIVGRIPGDSVPDRTNAPIESPSDQGLIFYPDESNPLFGDATVESKSPVQQEATTSNRGYIVGFVLVANFAVFSSVLLFFFRREKHRDQNIYRRLLSAFLLQQSGDNEFSSITVASGRKNRDYREHSQGSFVEEISSAQNVYLMDGQNGFMYQNTSCSSAHLHPVPEHDWSRSFRESGNASDSNESFYDEDDLSRSRTSKEDQQCIQGERDYYEGARNDAGVFGLTDNLDERPCTSRSRPHLD